MYSKGIYARSNGQNLHSIVGPYANSCNDDNLEFIYLWLIEVGKIKVQIKKKLNRMKVKGLVRKEKSKNRDRPNQSGLWTVL